ncbi:dUTP diphosphatase [Pelagibacteraceae bacterium]|jgi:dUTP pyrophosphatase|nr:dUTP diphosphatase [Pelagibacteraceae bacterium]
MTKILIKRLSKEVSLPKYQTNGSSGMDLAAYIDNNMKLEPGRSIIVPTGLSVSIPKGFEIQIRPRSGLAAKKNISVLNTPGTIDADYRGEIKVILINLGDQVFVVENGSRIAQMVVCPIIQARLEEVDELNDTIRGSDGFGSTGTK